MRAIRRSGTGSDSGSRSMLLLRSYGASSRPNAATSASLAGESEKCAFQPATYNTATPLSLNTGLWYASPSSTVGTALRMAARTRSSAARTFAGFDAMYSSIDRKRVVFTIFDTITGTRFCQTIRRPRVPRAREALDR
jgi:hypothetical protein